MCIVVPYGTAYWQVGDNNEQNGTVQIVVTREEQFMIEKIIRLGLPDLQIMPTGIILLVNKLWEVSFWRLCMNKNTIY